MRRALLTSRAAAPITVGNAGAFGATSFGANMFVDCSGAASGPGTITTAKFRALVASSGVRVVTGSLSGTNFTVRAVSSPLTASSGDNTLSVSLAVVAGDFIGYWDSNAGLVSANATTGQIGYVTTGATVPIVGQVLALSLTSGYRASILGTYP